MVSIMQLRTTYDDRWFARLDPILTATGEIYSALELPPPAITELRRRFEASNYTENISQLPIHIDTDALLIRNQQLRDLLNDIEQNETVAAVRDAYSAKILEAIANHDMLRAAAMSDAKEFARQNTLIYGSPDPEIFRASCAWIRHELKAAGRENVTARAALELVPDIEGDLSLLQPNQDTFTAVKVAHFEGEYITHLFGDGGIPTSDRITQMEGDEICRRILASLHCDYELADTTNGFWGVLHSKKQIIRPAQYNMRRDDFVGIVLHEIGSHLIEAMNGQNQPLRLLEIGLDRYEAGNEGRALLREQIVYPSFAGFMRQPAWRNRVAIHMAVSLAVGVDGDAYTFSRLYEVLYKLFYFWQSQAGDSDAEQTSRNIAWLMTIRVTKGTDGTGGAYYKDIVYLEGNINCWNTALANPMAVLDGDLGKFDIANGEHIKILKALGVLTSAP